MVRRKLTPETRAAWRAAALRNEPWLKATGPRTEAGKAKASANSKIQRKGPHSYREILAFAKAMRAELKSVDGFIKQVEARLQEPPGD